MNSQWDKNVSVPAPESPLPHYTRRPGGAQWPTIEGTETATPAAACAEPAQPVRIDARDDAQMMADATAAMAANRTARREAQARGAPVNAVTAVMSGTAMEAPEIPGWGRPCRMTAAIRQIMVKWSKLPAEDRLPDNVCLMFIFLRPRDAWAMLSSFNERTLQWSASPGDLGHANWRHFTMKLALDLTEMDVSCTEVLAQWVTERLTDFFVRPAETPETMKTQSIASEAPAAEPRAAGPAGGCAPSTALPSPTPAETSAAPCGTST